MDTLGFFTLACCLSIAFGDLVIKEINGPESIENGTTDVVVLDCDFEANGESSLVLKWFYNGEYAQIYQWIPPNQRVFSSGKLKSNIDVHYNVTNDRNTMYRALKLDNITPNMTGNYTCKVSSDESEAEMTKQLIIYTPAKSGLEMAIYSEDSAVSCSAKGVYPKPDIEISISGNGTYDTDENEDVITDENGLFNVTKILTFDNETITDTITFVCNMTIPGTDYFETKTLEHSIEEDPEPQYYESNIVEDHYYTETIIFSNSTGKTASSAQDNSAVPKLSTTTGIILLLTTFFFLFVK